MIRRQQQNQQNRMAINEVLIEHCKNCKDHQWNTRHHQSRYLNLFNQFKTILEKQGLKVQQSRVSRLGSFQITMEGVLLYSKLKSQLFPDANLLCKHILNFREQMKNESARPEVIEKYRQSVDKFNQTAISSISFKSHSSNKHHHKTIDLNRSIRSTSFFSSKKFIKPYVETFNPEKILWSRRNKQKDRMTRTLRTFCGSKRMGSSLVEDLSKSNVEVSREHRKDHGVQETQSCEPNHQKLHSEGPREMSQEIPREIPKEPPVTKQQKRLQDPQPPTQIKS